MRNITLFLTIILLTSCSSKIEKSNILSGRNSIDFNQNWKFYKGDVNDGDEVKFNDSLWQQVDLPHDWSIKETFSPKWASGTGFLPGGIGWYRKTFFVSTEEQGRKVFIRFGGIYNNSTVWINGHELGFRPNGYVSFQYELSEYLNYGQENIIAVKVDHSKFADSRWYNGSGIYRNVELVSTYPLSVKNWGVYATTPIVTKSLAELAVEVQIENDFSKDEKFILENCLVFGKDTVAVVTDNLELDSSDDELYSQTLQVKNPHLWSTDSPTLYQLITSIKQDGQIVDQTTQNIGIRDIKFVPNKGMYINGDHIKIKGICMHEDAGCLGVAVPTDVYRIRLQQLKELGCNAIRLVHNPFSKEFLDLCDELGFFVVEEAFDEWELPKRKWVSGWNKGYPAYEGYSHDFKKWHEQDLTDMILRDRNHPSIMMWSIGNEIDYPTDPYSHPCLNNEDNPIAWARYNPKLPDGSRMGKLAWKLATIVKKNDTTRPVTAGLALSVMASATGYANVLDVVGYNYQQAVYEADHHKFPERIMYASESKKTYEAWKFVEDHDYFLGQFVWKGFDFIGEAHEFPYHNIPTGLIDLIGDKRSEYYYRQSMWTEKPLVHIGTALVSDLLTHKDKALNIYGPKWEYNEGDNVSVAVFSNCNEVELFVNGKSLEKRILTPDNQNMQIWEIPFQKGVIKAIGKRKGEKDVVYELRTPSDAIKIVAEADKSEIKVNSKDIVQVYITIMDENNRVVTTKDRPITCVINGPLELLALGDANPKSIETFADHRQKSFQGRLVAYFKNKGEIGTASINFTGSNLESDSITIEILK